MPAKRPLFVAEPPALWHARPPLVVDCSVLASQLFEEADADIASDALRAHALHAPALLSFEFANVARSKSRAGAPPERTLQALTHFEGLRIELHPVPVLALHALALRTGLSAYDAAYLWLAADLEAPLATFDQRLGEAAARYLNRPEQGPP
jgi:predicted nucleic acid-binding protein